MVGRVLFLGMSAAARDISRETELAAGCSAPVLLTGEPGVGKTLVGRTIHARSRRSSLPLITIDCRNRRDRSFETELAPHLPEGGTILLREPGELSLNSQRALLKFLEPRDGRAGSNAQPERRIDTRIISMTRRPLFYAVMRKRFLPELYYRLNVLHIEIPPLRERREDVPALLDGFFAADQAGVSVPAAVTDDALQLLMAYSWPGNVRELETLARRLTRACASGRIDADGLPRSIVNAARLPAQPVHEELFARLAGGQASFWGSVYEPFMAHDLSRRTLRELVRLGVERAGGDYRALAAILQVADEDYQRFIEFLRKYQFLYPFGRLRLARATLRSPSRRRSDTA